VKNLIRTLKSSTRLVQKQHLAGLWRYFPLSPRIDGNDILLGDDAAAIKSGEGFLLLAAEGVYQPLLDSNPYLAGRTSVLTNVNDIYAMGGRPVALVDVLFSKNESSAGEALRGIRDNADRYGVPVVGGHTTLDAEAGSLSVFILGKAERLLSGFNARPDDDILLATALDGRFYASFNFWDSSSGLSVSDLVRQLEILPGLAESGLADAARDVSMAGLIGSTLMMLESSKAGAEIFIDRIPAPADVPLQKWLLTFPSYGFVISSRPGKTQYIKERFRDAGLACETIGRVINDSRVFFTNGNEKEVFWDFGEEPLIGVNPKNGEKVKNGG
jgi:AIR synthase-related protein